MRGDAGTALVTGAAGGIGSAYARALAARGHQTIVSDLPGPALDAVAAQVGARAVPADLSRQDGVDRLAAEAAGVSFLMLAAGFGTHALFHEADLAQQRAMVAVHVDATVALARAALPGMVSRGSGSLVSVASAGAYMRFPRDATYIGTKAFLVAWAECLAIELRGTGVAVQALCPAWVRTGFASRGDYAAAGYRSPIPGWLFTSPEVIVAASLRALGRGTVCVPTLRGRLAVAAIGSPPGRLALQAARDRRRP